MFVNCFLLAISVSIDSFGIGITYGIKSTKISAIGKIILFAISFFTTLIAIYFGDIFKGFLPDIITKLLGSFMLIFIGITIIYNSFKNPNISYDFDNSHFIDAKEALVLGIALSLDAFCIGFSGSIAGINFDLFPFMVAIFQFAFLTSGNILGKKINSLINFPDNICSIISGILMISIGIIKFFA